MGDFQNRRAVVTGAASGIGQAVARRLLDSGAAVVAVDRDARGLQALEALGAQAIVLDLAEAHATSTLVAAAGEADYLVNAAGILRMAPLFEVGREVWREIFAVNAEAVFFLCQALGPRLRPGGAIVNLSSTAAKTGSTLEAAIYAASKAAVLSMTRSFAYALAHRPVRVNAVCPGIIDTPMQDTVLRDMAQIRGGTPTELHAARLSTVPLGRAASADECAEVICFLLSDAAAYMTGQSVNISGGLVTW